METFSVPTCEVFNKVPNEVGNVIYVRRWKTSMTNFFTKMRKRNERPCCSDTLYKAFSTLISIEGATEKNS